MRRQRRDEQRQVVVRRGGLVRRGRCARYAFGQCLPAPAGTPAIVAPVDRDPPDPRQRIVVAGDLLPVHDRLHERLLFRVVRLGNAGGVECPRQHVGVARVERLERRRDLDGSDARIDGRRLVSRLVVGRIVDAQDLQPAHTDLQHTGPASEVWPGRDSLRSAALLFAIAEVGFDIFRHVGQVWPESSGCLRSSLQGAQHEGQENMTVVLVGIGVAVAIFVVLCCCSRSTPSARRRSVWSPSASASGSSTTTTRSRSTARRATRPTCSCPAALEVLAVLRVEKLPWVQVPAGEIGVVIAQVGQPLPIGAKSAVYKPEFGNFTRPRRLHRAGRPEGRAAARAAAGHARARSTRSASWSSPSAKSTACRCRRDLVERCAVGRAAQPESFGLTPEQLRSSVIAPQLGPRHTSTWSASSPPSKANRCPSATSPAASAASTTSRRWRPARTRSTAAHRPAARQQEQAATTTTRTSRRSSTPAARSACSTTRCSTAPTR